MFPWQNRPAFLGMILPCFNQNYCACLLSFAPSLPPPSLFILPSLPPSFCFCVRFCLKNRVPLPFRAVHNHLSCPEILIPSSPELHPGHLSGSWDDLGVLFYSGSSGVNCHTPGFQHVSSISQSFCGHTAPHPGSPGFCLDAGTIPAGV